MRPLITVLSLLLLTGLSSVRAEERPVTDNKIHKKEQQLENEVKTERDRPQKKERAKAATGRVEDGVREFGRGLQGVMKEAGVGDGPPAAGAKKPEAKSESKPAAAKPGAPPPPPRKAAKPKPAAAPAPAAPPPSK